MFSYANRVREAVLPLWESQLCGRRVPPPPALKPSHKKPPITAIHAERPTPGSKLPSPAKREQALALKKPCDTMTPLECAKLSSNSRNFQQRPFVSDRNMLRLTLAFVFFCSSVLATSPPNIVVILADDYGYGSAGCYGADGKLVQTPNIDRLAREGRRFTDASTTSSVCSPTRYSVLTGRYCWRTSLKFEVLSTFAPLHIEPERLNMASLLKKHGYRTASVGKWHLGYGTATSEPKWRTDYTGELSPGPLDIGFDYHFAVPSNHGDLTGIYVENRFVYGLRSGKIPASMKLPGPVPDDDNFKPTYEAEDTEGGRGAGKILDLDAPRRKNERVMATLSDKATRWIEEQKSDAPFFLYFTPVAVHNPVTPDKDIAGTSAAGLYGDWIHELDRSVGRILESLDKTGRADNTLIIFTSDNGGVYRPVGEGPQTEAFNAGLKVNGTLRGGKHNVWQGGFKVPFIVRWPGKAPAGTTCDEMISLADILATTAAVVGEPLPTSFKGAEDSYNLLPAILGETTDKPIRRDMIVHSADGVFALRKGPWKWIEGIPEDGIKPGVRKSRGDEFHSQLYNVQTDPAETKDVSADHPEIIAEFTALLDRYRDGGYSREVPPESAMRSVQIPTPQGEVILKEEFANVPDNPWVKVRGIWSASDSTLWGSQAPKDTIGAALRGPGGFTDATLQYEMYLEGASSHNVRLQLAQPDHVVNISVNRHQISIQRQRAESEGVPRSEILAQTPVSLRTGRWYPFRITLKGSQVSVQTAGETATAVHAVLAEEKKAFALMANGEKVGFRHLILVR